MLGVVPACLDCIFYWNISLHKSLVAFFQPALQPSRMQLVTDDIFQSVHIGAGLEHFVALILNSFLNPKEVEMFSRGRL